VIQIVLPLRKLSWHLVATLIEGIIHAVQIKVLDPLLNKKRLLKKMHLPVDLNMLTLIRFVLFIHRVLELLGKQQRHLYHLLVQYFDTSD
jgi:hypothetical protein